MDNITVKIERDGVLIGRGRWTEDCEIVCLPDPLEDDTCEALCEALAGLPQDEEHWRGPVHVERPDGTYTASLDRITDTGETQC